MKKRVPFKRILSAFLISTLLISTFPSFNLTVDAKWGTAITDSDTFEKVIDKVRSDENAYMAGRLRLLIYGDESSNIYYVGHSFPGSSAYQSLTDGEVGQKISFKGAQCWAFAEYCYYKFFGTAQYVNPDYSKTHVNEKLTADNLKSVLADARCGAHLRVGKTHSVCFVCEDESQTGFYYLDAINYGGYHVYLHYDTYQSFCDTYSSKTIQWLIMPNTYPVCDEPGDRLTITNAKIPVNIKKGSGFDVIGTTFVSDCDITSIEFGVYSSAGTEQFSATIHPNCPAYRVNAIADDKFFPFSSLSSGSYVYRITAYDESGQEVRCEQAFTVSSGSTAYLTESFYSYSLTRFESSRYYEVAEDTDSFPSPEVSMTSTSITAGTILSADASHTDENGDVWVRAGAGRWLRESALIPHEHTLSETGLCVCDGCGYDATPLPASLTAAVYAVLSSVPAYDRPYTAESEVCKTLSAFDTVNVTGRVENLLGETWLLSDAGYLPAEQVATVTSLTVVNCPTKTEYHLSDTLSTDGLLVRGEFSDGSVRDIPLKKLSFSYSFRAAGTSSVKVSFAGKSASFSVTVLPSSGTETWLVTTTMKIRTGPGTNYDSDGTYAADTLLTVTEIVKDSSYLWGRTADGWVALQVLSSGNYYCTYQSGALYEISYDANGGEGTVTPTLKTSVEAAVLSSDKPALSGYTFLGWAVDEDAVTPDYYAGGLYTANASLTLYAVWQADSLLSGSLSFTGEPVYGNKLIADLTALTPSDAPYSLSWLRDGTAIPGATAVSYVLTAADIGHEISLSALGCNGYTGTVNSEAVTVSKKAGAAVASPVLLGATKTTLTLEAVSGAEYSSDGMTWQSDEVFTDLEKATAYTLYLRMAETDVSLAGPASSAVFSTCEVDKYSVNLETNVLAGVTAGTDASHFLASVEGAAGMFVTDSNGEKVDGSRILATGMKLNLSGLSYTLAVIGDPSGDGAVTATDLTFLARYVGGIESSGDAACFCSCDINEDSSVTALDLSLLARCVGGIIIL